MPVRIEAGAFRPGAPMRGVIGHGLLHRVAGVAQGDEIDALDHPAILDVQTGNDANLQHAARVRARAGSMAPS
jgi:hypothetical protein